MDRKTAFEVGASLGLVKRALSWEDITGAMGKAYETAQPYLPSAGIGAGIGGILGLVRNLARTGDDREKSSLLADILLPAILGGGAGVGTKALSDYLTKLKYKKYEMNEPGGPAEAWDVKPEKEEPAKPHEETPEAKKEMGAFTEHVTGEKAKPKPVPHEETPEAKEEMSDFGTFVTGEKGHSKIKMPKSEKLREFGKRETEKHERYLKRQQMKKDEAEEAEAFPDMGPPVGPLGAEPPPAGGAPAEEEMSPEEQIKAFEQATGAKLSLPGGVGGGGGRIGDVREQLRAVLEGRAAPDVTLGFD